MKSDRPSNPKNVIKPNRIRGRLLVLEVAASASGKMTEPRISSRPMTAPKIMGRSWAKTCMPPKSQSGSASTITKAKIVVSRRVAPTDRLRAMPRVAWVMTAITSGTIQSDKCPMKLLSHSDPSDPLAVATKNRPRPNRMSMEGTRKRLRQRKATPRLPDICQAQAKAIWLLVGPGRA